MLHPLQALKKHYLFLPCFGLFCPSHLSSSLPLTHTPFRKVVGSDWAMRCNVCGGNMMALKLLFCLPQAQLCLLALSLMFELEGTAQTRDSLSSRKLGSV